MARDVVVQQKINKVTVSRKGVQGTAGSQILTGPTPPSNLQGKPGDYYVDTTRNLMYGPKELTGWPAEPVFSGFERNLLGKVMEVSTASTSWVLQHDLGYNPNVTVIASSGDVIEGDIEYIDENTLVLTFFAAIAGRAILS